MSTETKTVVEVATKTNQQPNEEVIIVEAFVYPFCRVFGICQHLQ